MKTISNQITPAEQFGHLMNKTVRFFSNYNQAELAEKIGCSRQALINAYKGKHVMRWSMVENILNVINVEPVFLEWYIRLRSLANENVDLAQILSELYLYKEQLRKELDNDLYMSGNRQQKITDMIWFFEKLLAMD